MPYGLIRLGAGGGAAAPGSWKAGTRMRPTHLRVALGDAVGSHATLAPREPSPPSFSFSLPLPAPWSLSLPLLSLADAALASSSSLPSSSAAAVSRSG